MRLLWCLCLTFLVASKYRVCRAESDENADDSICGFYFRFSHFEYGGFLILGGVTILPYWISIILVSVISLVSKYLFYNAFVFERETPELSLFTGFDVRVSDLMAQ